MHNGEKGDGKWSCSDGVYPRASDDHHPQSLGSGKHYSHPVELIDIYPTVLDLMQVDSIVT